MKRKRLVPIIIIFVVCFFCTACNGNVTRDIRHAGFTVGGLFECRSIYPKDSSDNSYERIRYFTGTHMITNDGKIYELSLGKTYKNEQNCREASNTYLRVEAIMDNRIIKATDGKYYYLVGQNNVDSYTQVPTTDNSYRIYDLLLKGNDVLKVITADSSLGLFYVLKVDGNIYGVVIGSVDRNSLPIITTNQVVYDKNDFGSNIIDFNYAGKSLATYVKTENAIYRMKITNQKECSKYADVDCQYELQEDPIFETYRDRILVYNGSLLITD